MIGERTNCSARADKCRRARRFLAAALLTFLATPAWAAIGIDVTVSRNATTNSAIAASPTFSTTAANELLLAFVATSRAGGSDALVTNVNGGGLTWELVVRTAAQRGTSEIWRAFAPSPLSNISVTATLSRAVRSSITVVSFTGVDTSGINGSGAIGATASRSASSGAPSASVVTTRNDSWVFGVGNDSEEAIARTLGAGQTLVHQYLASSGDTFWVQRRTNPTPASGTTVTINDAAPIGNRYNLSVVEILADATIATAWDISGTVGPAANGAGTLLFIGGALVWTNADDAGNFRFTGMPNGTYAVAPSKAGYTFSPSSRSVTISGASVTGIDFIATPVGTSFSISGTISPASLAAGTRMTLGEQGDVFPDSAGNYRFVNVPNGTFTVIPSKAGYVFSPSSRQVTINGVSATGINFATQAAPSNAGQWGAPFDLGLVAVNMVMMHTGKVLMYSGSFSTSAAERVWDPITGAITLVPNPYYNLFCSGHSQLADGRILVAGGYNPNSLGAANANIFDPVTLSWSALPNMAYRRWYPTSTTLPDGRALITSGAQTCLTCLADVPEIFDPATGLFTTLPTARLGIPYYPFMFVLPNGTVINAGANENPAATSALDLTTNTWTTVDPNVKDGHSAAMYEPGKILKTGTAADSGESGPAAATAYVLDATQPSPAWRQVAPMAFPRAFHNTTLLPDGNVLVTGGGRTLDGYDVGNSVFDAELWSPITETWQTLSRAAIPRLYHSTALLLPDARVLVAGSGNDGPAVDQTRAEIFSPPYLFRGARPTITDVPATAQYGTTIELVTPEFSSIARISLIRPGAVTHSFDEDQRMVSLTFTKAPGGLKVEMPANANLAPPGYYMLFIVNTAGVPSVASFVHLPPPGADAEPPTSPTDVSAEGAIGSASVSWTASTDNTGVALYNIHRSLTSRYLPTLANRVGQSTSTTFINTGVPSGTYYYVVTAQDVVGNVSGPSVEASVFVFADTTPPAVSITAPDDQSTVTGSITVSASASDDVGIASVRFTLDGNALGGIQTAPPYSIVWNTATTSNDSHTLTAIATDAAGNTAEAAVLVAVSNTAETPNGLVAAYGFNEAAGMLQVTDASGQGNTGTIAGATRIASGKFGGALSFDGTSAWVTVADAASLDLTTGITIEAWVRPTALTGWRSVVMKESAAGLAYSLYSGNDAMRAAGYVNVNEDIGVTATSAMVLDIWTHLTFTYDGSMLRMFVNGAEVSSQAASGAAASTAGVLRIGGNAYWGEYFKGIIDEVRLYNRALTATEIQTDMATPIP
jgi:hypothetical protein